MWDTYNNSFCSLYRGQFYMIVLFVVMQCNLTYTRDTFYKRLVYFSFCVTTLNTMGFLSFSLPFYKKVTSFIFFIHIIYISKITLFSFRHKHQEQYNNKTIIVSSSWNCLLKLGRLDYNYWVWSYS